MVLPDSSILTNIRFTGNARPGNGLFEKKYIGIRSMENRLYSDEELERLPRIDPTHCHAAEWKLRRRSSEKLIRYLSAKGKHLMILEVGCGNGWFSHALAGIPGARVTGMDINFTELQQAARVFNDDARLHFIYGDIFTGIPAEAAYDVILFAASIQYFQSLRETLSHCLQHLHRSGEVHLLDSHFYKAGEAAAAKKRTLDYFSAMGYPEMAEYYFHHDIRELDAFQARTHYNPGTTVNRLMHQKNPFHWVSIKNDTYP